MANLQKTSLQLPSTILEQLDLHPWPGLTRSEVLRLYIERGQYLTRQNGEYISNLADQYDPILQEALEDLDYDVYRLAARSLPDILSRFFNEALGERGSGGGWRDPDNRNPLDPQKLRDAIAALPPGERIGLLDYVVAQRHRRIEAKKSGKKK